MIGEVAEVESPMQGASSVDDTGQRSCRNVLGELTSQGVSYPPFHAAAASVLWDGFSSHLSGPWLVLPMRLLFCLGRF